MSWDGNTPLVWDAKHLRIATDAAGVALWSWNVDTDQIAMDERAHAMWGVPRSNEPVTFEHLSSRIHPEDLDRVRRDFQATREVLGAYDINFRIVHEDAVRWVSARGQGDDLGIVGRVMFGVFLNVTEAKEAQQQQETLAGEMSHRVKNLLALASALTVIAARSSTTTAAMSQDLRQRLTALGRAHDLVRSNPASGASAHAWLGPLLDLLLAPYVEHPGRLQVQVPAVPVGESAATALALVVHELATNSIKYGALSVAAGTLQVSCTIQGDAVVIVWTERGGHPAAAPSGPPGFGSKLVAQSLAGQLAGSIALDWPAEGLVATLRLSAARLSL